MSSVPNTKISAIKNAIKKKKKNAIFCQIQATIFIYENISKSVLLDKCALSPVVSPSNPTSRTLPESLS